MYKKVSLVAITLFCAFGLNAQERRVQSNYERLKSEPRAREILEIPRSDERRFAIEMWHVGFVLLNDGSKVEGLVKVDISNDEMQIDSNETIQTYAANQVSKFEVLIAGDENWKTFFTLPLRDKNGFYRPAFFELVVEGSTSLLFRDRIVLSTRVIGNSSNERRWNIRNNNPNGPNGEVYYTRSLSREMFLLSSNGILTKLSNKRKKVINSFDGNHEELKRIIRRNRLNMKYSGHVKRLVEAYNKVVE